MTNLMMAPKSYDLSNDLHMFIYDNMQQKALRRTEAGAGSKFNSNQTVELRTAREIIKF